MSPGGPQASSPHWRRVAWVVALTLAAVYGFRLVNLGLEVRRARQNEALMAGEVRRLQAQVEALSTAAALAQTDAYVERMAREELDMARPGDRVFAPVPAPSASPAPQPPPPAAPASAWERFLGWLRGD